MLTEIDAFYTDDETFGFYLRDDRRVLYFPNKLKTDFCKYEYLLNYRSPENYLEIAKLMAKLFLDSQNPPSAFGIYGSFARYLSCRDPEFHVLGDIDIALFVDPNRAIDFLTDRLSTREARLDEQFGYSKTTEDKILLTGIPYRYKVKWPRIGLDILAFPDVCIPGINNCIGWLAGPDFLDCVGRDLLIYDPGKDTFVRKPEFWLCSHSIFSTDLVS